MSKLELYEANEEIAIVTGTCSHDCPDTCSWQVAVEKSSGQAVDIWGNAAHPITQGRLCGKVDRYLERTYHRDRLTTPLKRVGPKGSGQFVPVSWESAIKAIATRFQEIEATDGAEAIMPYSYAGTMGHLQGEGMAARFWYKLGASHLARTICAAAGFEGYRYTIGASEGTEMEAFAHARFILIWGSNTLTSNLHLWPFIQQARKAGAKLIVIDPAATRTAAAADEWIAIKPGTDGALALALMHEIINHGWHDAEYVAQHTVGFDALADRVAAWTPERAAAITGIPAARIRQLAQEYATTPPAVIRINYGLQRHYGGGMAVRTIACLPALIGAWRHYGGGIQLSNSGYFRHLNVTKLQHLELLAGRQPRTFNMNRLGDALSLDPARRAQALYHPRPNDPQPTASAAGSPVKAMIIYNSNPAAVVADQSAVVAGLAREDLFTVVLDHFQTDTADYADYLLPATTQLEHWDLHSAYGHTYWGLNRPAIAPVGQSLPNSEIFRRIAQAMGYQEDCFYEEDETILRAFVDYQRHARFEGITWEALLRDGFVRLNLPTPNNAFAEGNFPTPSGKCEFYSERMKRDGYDPLPTYTAPAWQSAATQVVTDDEIVDGRTATVADSLVCISPPAHSFLNSSFANVDRFRQREGEPMLWIHPEDAAPRQIREGDAVRVANELGDLTLRAQITERIVPGTVLAPGVWWAKFSPDGRNINRITPQAETDMGASASFYDTLVTVEPVAPVEAPIAPERVAVVA